MNKLALLAGVDIPIPDLQLVLHQPSIKEISYVGELEYFSALQTLCFNKDTILAANPQGASRLSTMNDFQIFMMLMNPPEKEAKMRVQNSMFNTLTILFPGYGVQILPNGIGLYLNNPVTKHNLIINDTNFDVLKNAVNEITGVNNQIGGENANFNPKNAKAAAIAAKLMRGRTRSAAAKGYSTDGVLGRYVSILSVGLMISLQECLKLTVYQLYDLIERYGLYVGWDLDIRTRLAGGNPDDKPDDWMKDLH